MPHAGISARPAATVLSGITFGHPIIDALSDHLLAAYRLGDGIALGEDEISNLHLTPVQTVIAPPASVWVTENGDSWVTEDGDNWKLEA